MRQDTLRLKWMNTERKMCIRIHFKIANISHFKASQKTLADIKVKVDPCLDFSPL